MGLIRMRRTHTHIKVIFWKKERCHMPTSSGLTYVLKNINAYTHHAAIDGRQNETHPYLE